MDRRTFLVTFPLAIAGPSLLARTAAHLGRVEREDEDALICNRKFALAISQSLRTLPIHDIVVQIGLSFTGTEYVAQTLEVTGEERLVVNLRGLDCVSFCENAVVFARCIKRNAKTFEEYKRELQWIRYRGGVIDGYPSRLHYFSDYIYDNERKNVWKDVTEAIGGVPYKKAIDFMSTHPDSYRQLREQPEFVRAIQEQEAEINKRKMYYLPKDRLTDTSPKIQNGDIIAVTTNIPGLDISHTGVAIRREGKIFFLHAPDVGRKVTISQKPLAGYLASNKRQTGIMVARLLEPVG